MRRLLVLLMVLAPALAESPTPSPAPAPSPEPSVVLDQLENERRQLEGALTGKGTFEASAGASVADELPRLEAAAHKLNTADALVAYATALAGAGRYAEAKDTAVRAAAADPKHELAAVSARELARFDGHNGADVLQALTARRHELERRDELAEARRSLPALAARVAAKPDPDALIEQAAALIVCEDFGPAKAAAQAALALAPKNAAAGMIVDELSRPDPRPPEAVRTAITMRWLRINAGASASR